MPVFEVLLLLVSIGAVVHADLRIRRALEELTRPERTARAQDPYVPGLHALARLAGHLDETVLAVMHGEGRLVAFRSGVVTLTDVTPRDPVEDPVIQAVRGVHGDGRSADLRRLLLEAGDGPAAGEIDGDLARRGLTREWSAHYEARRAFDPAPKTAAFVAAAAGASLWWTLAHGRGFALPLAAFLPVLTWAVVVARRRRRPRRRGTTDLGDEVLARAAEALGDPPSAPYAVALGGLVALPPDHDLRLAHEGSEALAEAAWERRRQEDKKREAERRARERAPGHGPDSMGGIGIGGLGCGGCAGCGGGL
ncbi:hypothetical protein OHS33_34350 [Streptomyces sp. NBC_00536]|uniref:hypothetical protein n=1 Tax=Streptomyces sp. NBC_00536 TaxID=2975769 RepID=UPI002E8089AD|nr:hypothetical protein [Streptomyces sp. NBC_00536]WUC83004.1 hypothetical protein OHS33_34350 [Streptomyces sp. NBC_00536]